MSDSPLQGKLLSPVHDTTPDRIFMEIEDYLQRVKDGHLTPENALARIIEHAAKGNPRFVQTILDDAGVTFPCDCWDGM